ncbi:MAG TPA: UDP-N-acetylmuramoyl-L-alanine--D-glutamate ligase [Pyrinomonadaceae bacterium]|nr:UDP-N-acetylmuramoyl-L-alanine--D-glutamate ligase [Pyrinomonadaceae bacterium]
MDLAGKKVLIVGAARSGIAAAKFLQARGAVVALTDRKDLDRWSDEARALKEIGVGLVPGEVPTWLLDQLELVVVSPGVPSNIIPIRYAERAGAEVIGEVELAFRFLKGRVIAITGSNGKTTTTSLIGRLLQDAGLPVQVGGNIGTALISMVANSRDDGWTVVEVSSFQLETIKSFHPSIAIVLNVTPNHMDRYETFTDYAAAKHRIFMNQERGDVAVLNADDPTVSSWERGLKATVVQFSTKRELDRGLFLRRTELVVRNHEDRVVIRTDEMKLRGIHNVENVLAALAAGIAAGAPLDSMRETVKNFEPVEHRLEFVTELNGVKFYNDSKATSVDATLKALEAFAADDGKVVLILGGLGKKAPYEPLARLVKEKVRKLVLVGEDAETIARELGEFAPFENARDMNDAVRRSFSAAEKGDVVLLAPACASFDMFESFEHRGKVFKSEISDLKSEIRNRDLRSQI